MSTLALFRSAPALFGCSLMALTAGCSDVVIKSDYSNGCSKLGSFKPCSHGVPVGLVYSLPKGQALLIVSRKKITATSLPAAQSAVALANQALADAIGKLTDAQQAQQKHRSPTESEQQKAQDEAAVAAAKAQQASAQASVDSATQTLANLRAGIDNYSMTYALTPLAVVPDGQRRFVANLAHHSYRDDSLKLSVVNGLLTTSNSQSTDQTANIIMSLANAAIGVTTFVGAGIPAIPSPAVAR